MNIDALHFNNLWFETPTGERQPWDPEHDEQPPIDTHPYTVSRFPREVRTHYYRRRTDGGYGGTDEMFSGGSSWSESLALALATGGDRFVLDGRFLSQLFRRPRTFSLTQAIVIASEACERCMNALAYNYGLSWGYREGGPEWRRCGTECEMCRDMGFSGRNQEA